MENPCQHEKVSQIEYLNLNINEEIDIPIPVHSELG